MCEVNLSIVFHVHNIPYLNSRELGESAGYFLSSYMNLVEEGLLPQSTVFLSIPFLERASKQNSKYLKQFKNLVEEGSVECLGGGLIDPIFPLIPREMQQFQIKEYLTQIHKFLGVRPRGFMLPGFVWEDTLTEILDDNYFEYILLKDYQIKGSVRRITSNQGYWSMEYNGALTGIISSHDTLGQHFRNNEPNKILEYLESIPAESAQDSKAKRKFVTLDLPVFSLDKSKYLNDWFEHLREILLILKNYKKSKITLCNVSKQIDERSSLGTMCLTSAIGKNFGLDKGISSCREILVLQPECNLIHKKMLYLYRQIKKIEVRKDRREFFAYLCEAQEMYYYRNTRSIGGIQYVEDRSRCFAVLIEIEARLREYFRLTGIKVEMMDLLGNGAKQLYCSNELVGFLIEQQHGARLRTLEFKSKSINVINGYSKPYRLEEGHHHYDVTPASGLVDWVNHDIHDEEIWSDDNRVLLKRPYTYQLKKQQTKSQLIFSGKQYFQKGSEEHCFKIEKVMTVKEKSSSIILGYKVINNSFFHYQGYFGSEFHFTLSTSNLDYYKAKVDGKALKFDEESQSFENASLFYLRGKKNGTVVKWKFYKECKINVTPIYSVEEKEEEPLLQSLRVLVAWPVKFSGQEFVSIMSELILNKSRVML